MLMSPIRLLVLGAVRQHGRAHGYQVLGHIGEIMNLWVHSADAGVRWARGLIERIEGEAYTVAGEGDPFVGVLADDEPNPFAPDRHPEGVH